jgi:hypothetical protein
VCPGRLSSWLFFCDLYCFFALPVFVVGLILVIQREERFPKIFYPLVVAGIGVIGIVLLYDWPSINSCCFWEDSYLQLSVLEFAYFYLCVPFLYCCGISVSGSLLKKSA